MQKKIKKLCLVLLSVLTLAFTITACENIKLPSADISNTESGVVDENGNGNGNNSGNENGGNDEEKNPEDDPFYIWAGSIMDKAYLLSKNEYLVGYYELSGTVTEIDDANSTNSAISLYFDVYEPKGREMYCYKLTGSGVHDISVGDFITVYGRIRNYKNEKIEFDEGCELVSIGNGNGGTITPPSLEGDPYANMSTSTFYANYTPASDADDAYYRSLHGFMSGELETPDQAPTISSYQPKKGNQYIRNSEMLLSEDGRTYTVVDAYGKEAFKVYKGGAYITLEEVAAYVYAFGTYPANYAPSDDATDATDSIWGEYLRINHKSFSGDTSKYPYEPILPNISGCGGTLKYYEMDIGTTGTDCDPKYPSKLYNNGYSITRGAARIVYGKNDLDKDGVYEIGEFHVFYTYNHYNDFQEYLNYEGGWGEMFGNITGGGSISSKYDYNPTDYVEIVLDVLPTSSIASTSEIFYYDDKKFLGAMSYPIFCVV